MTQHRSRLRLGIAMAGVFAVLGISVPYLGLWLESRGLDEGQISLVMTSATWVRAAFTPFVGNLTDRRGRHRRMLLELAFLSTLFMVVQIGGTAFIGIFLFTLLASVCYSPVIPLVDALAIRTVQEAELQTEPRATKKPSYAAVRIWGSLSFLVVALAAGRFLEGRDREWILFLLIGTHVVALCSLVGLPRTQSVRATRSGPGGFKRLLQRREMILLFVAVALIQGSHGCYYAFGSIWWERVGHQRDFIGLLWSEGVLAEIVFFLFTARHVRIRPKTLLFIGAGAAIVRWTVIATRHDAISLLAVQWMHAGSFAATHLAAMRWVQAQVAPERVATAQTMLSTVGAGLGPGLAIAISGPLFARYEAGAFWAMVGFAVAGTMVTVFLPRADANTRGR